jgi:dUTPase
MAYNISSELQIPTNLEIRDLSGRIIKTISIISSSGIIDLEYLNPSVYFIVLNNINSIRFVVID